MSCVCLAKHKHTTKYCPLSPTGKKTKYQSATRPLFVASSFIASAGQHCTCRNKKLQTLTLLRKHNRVYAGFEDVCRILLGLEGDACAHPQVLLSVSWYFCLFHFWMYLLTLSVGCLVFSLVSDWIYLLFFAGFSWDVPSIFCLFQLECMRLLFTSFTYGCS